MSILIFGSSLVKRLYFYLLDNRKKDNLFNLESGEHISVFGKSGGKIGKTEHLELLEAQLQLHNHRNLILHIGGNDLDCLEADKKTVEELVLRLLTLCTFLKAKYSLEKIYVCQLLPRTRTRDCPPEIFNELVCLFNKQLKHHLSSLPNIVYWKLKGLQDVTIDNFCDGVHLNKTGQHKYYKALRGAITHLRNN